MIKTTGLIFCAALALAGCGGGGGRPGTCFGGPDVCGGVDPTPEPPPGDTDSALGLYRSTLGSGRTAHTLVLANGQVWVLYGQNGNASLLGGVAQGTYTADDGDIASTNFTDFSGDTGGITAGTLTGSYVPQESIAASAVFNTATTSISGSYDPDSDDQAVVADAAGTYQGRAAVTGGDAGVPGGDETASIAVSSTGVLTGSTGSGCNVSGTLLPNTNSNSYNVTLTLAGGMCGNNTTTVRGVAILDGSRIYSAALDGGRTEAFIFAGGR